MAYDFSTRLDRNGERMKELHQNSLVYTRGASSVLIYNYTPEKVNVLEYVALGIVAIEEKMQAFVFDTAELASLDPPLPKLNDKITINVNGSPVTFELFPLASPDNRNSQPYTFVTSTRKRIRVNTKQITISA